MSSEPWTPPNSEFPPPKAGEPELFRAARVGDHDAIRAAIAAGAEIDQLFDLALNPDARESLATPLMVAAGSGDGATVETVRLLLDLGAKPSHVERGESAATFAARGLGWNYRPGGDAARLDLLLKLGAPIRPAGRRHGNIVADIAATGDAERLAVALDHGLPPNTIWTEEDGRRRAERMARFQIPALELPPELELDAELREAFEEIGAEATSEVDRRVRGSMEAGPDSYEIPLFAAAESGNAVCVRLLLQRGADAGQMDNDGVSALWHAASAEVVQELVAAGADLTQTRQYADDVLREALEHYNEDPTPSRRGVIEALLEAGVPLERTDEFGQTRLSAAAFAEQPEAVDLLLELGHPVGPGPGRATALHSICWHWDHDDERDEGTRRIVRALLAAGIDANHPDPDGNTPLHECVAGDGANIVAALVLLEHGADPNARNNDGETPLHFLYNNHFEYAKVVPVLLRHGADPLCTDGRGRTVLDTARDRAAGVEPDWRKQQWSAESGPPCGWKAPAAEGDQEMATLAMLEAAAKRGPRR